MSDSEQMPIMTPQSPRVTSSKSKGIQFTMICDKERQQMSTFKKLELANICHFCVKIDEIIYLH